MAVLTMPGVDTDVRLSAMHSEGAGIYRIVPSGVARPDRTEDLQALVRAARDAEITLVPRGAGTGMTGGNVGPGVVVDLRMLDGAGVEVDAESRTARCAAGATCAAVDGAAARSGLRLPPVPSSWRWATLGGMVGTNAAGARSFRYGSIRPWVAGLTVVTSDADILSLARGTTADESVGAVARFAAGAEPVLRAHDALIRRRFPLTRKNSAGYALDAWLASGDLLDLVIGSEGTLAVVTEVVVRLDPRPETRVGLRLVVRDDQQLATALAQVADSGASSIELLDRTFLAFAAGDLPAGEQDLLGRAGGVLLVEFEGTEEAVASWTDVWRRRAAPVCDHLTVAPDGTALEDLWAIRHAASPRLASLDDGRRSLQVIEDGCVPPERLADYLAGVRRIAARQNVTAVLFGHAGDGHVHVNLLPDVTRPGWERTLGTIFEGVSDLQRSLGGTPSGEHGTGRLRAGLLERFYGPEVVDLFRLVKHAFDPTGLLNPGVLLDAAGPRTAAGPRPVPFANLKVGAGAAPLPDDIAGRLRDIERRGAWDADRCPTAGAVGDPA